MRRILTVILTLLASAPAAAEPIELTATPLPPYADQRAAAGLLEYLGGFELSSDSDSWGGISGASISPDGGVLTVVADKGRWYRLRLRHDADGRLTGIEASDGGRLKDEEGKPLKGKGVADAEGLAGAADGSYYVAFEGWHRLWQYRPASDPLRARARYVRPPKGLTSLPLNEGVEAAAVLPDGRLVLLSEGGLTETGDHLGWIGDGNRWSEIGLAPTGAFKPTDLAALPTGDLLLLERRVSLFGGFVARLSAIPAATIAPGARLAGRELAIVAEPLPTDNFEALAARPAADGSILIYLLSDDNFSAMERTLLLQFRWRP